MADTLSGLAQQIGALIRTRPVPPAAALDLAERLEVFADAEPRLSADTRTNLLTQLARAVAPTTPRDPDVALAALRYVVDLERRDTAEAGA